LNRIISNSRKKSPKENPENPKIIIEQQKMRNVPLIDRRIFRGILFN